MPDLSSLPPELIGPFAVVFALALFVSKIFDIIEKWRSFKSQEKEVGDTTEDAVSTPESAVHVGIGAPSYKTVTLSPKSIFIYSFVGAISISCLSTLMQVIFVESPEFIQGTLYNLGMIAVIAVASAVICAFFIPKKFRLISENRLVAALMGLGVSALLGMPISTIATIIQVNQIYG